MIKNNKEVSTSVVSTFNTKKKTKFNGSFTLGDFESGDLEVEYLGGFSSFDVDLTDEKTTDLCEDIIQEINSIKFFINYECNVDFFLECENHEIKVSFREYSPGMVGELYEFTISCKGKSLEIHELPIESHWGK